MQRLAAIASLLPPLDPADRVIDVGSGTGCLLPHLRERGASDILAVDLSPAMLQQLAARFPPPPGRCGNEPGARAPAACDKLRNCAALVARLCYLMHCQPVSQLSPHSA